MAISIQAGAVEAVVVALGSVEGKKPIKLAVRLARMIGTFNEYLQAWREQDLHPAIVKFTGGGEVVDAKEVPEFMKKYEEIFAKEVEIDVEPIKLEDIDIDGLTINEDQMAVLLETGVVVE